MKPQRVLPGTRNMSLYPETQMQCHRSYLQPSQQMSLPSIPIQSIPIPSIHIPSTPIQTLRQTVTTPLPNLPEGLLLFLTH